MGLEELQFKNDGTTHLKLAALPILMDVTKITKITGDYNNVRPYLFVDKMIGGDIKKLTDAPSQVLAILEKEIETDVYSTVKHVAKGLNLHNITMPESIKNMINLENYVYIGK